MPEENNSIPIEQKQISPHSDNVRKIVDLLGNLKKELALVLPKHLTPDRMVRLAVTQLKQNNKLWECEAKSFVACVMTASQVGLEPDGILGHAYIVPFWDSVNRTYKAQFIPGYKGFIKLARNSGEVQSISAHEVCKNDKFDFAYGLDERLEHIPARGDRGPIEFFYAVAKFNDGGHQIEVMTLDEIEKIRDNTENYKAFLAKRIKKSTWNDNFVEMGRKTTIRRIAKYLPLSVQKAAVLDGLADDGKLVNIDNLGDFVIDGDASEIPDNEANAIQPAQVENKPATRAEFKASLKPKEQPVPLETKTEPEKTEPMAAKPAPKTKTDLKLWIAIKDEVRGSLNRSKTPEALNEVLSGDKARDLRNAQPDLYEELKDIAMDLSSQMSQRNQSKQADFGITP